MNDHGIPLAVYGISGIPFLSVLRRTNITTN